MSDQPITDAELERLFQRFEEGRWSSHESECSYIAQGLIIITEFRRLREENARILDEGKAQWKDGNAAILENARLQARVQELEGERDSFKHQAEYEREARIAAADFPRNRHGYVPCERCGLDCGMDAIVPNEVWDTLMPDCGGGGMLCLWCMDEAADEKGIPPFVNTRIYFVGKVLRSELYPGDGLEERVQELKAALSEFVTFDEYGGIDGYYRDLWEAAVDKARAALGGWG